jgi:electron transfer flavoprotein alpha subunit
MANILIYSETNQGKPKPVTLEILSKCQGHTVDVVSFNEVDSEGVQELAKYGAENIFRINNSNLGQYSPDGYASALKGFLADKSYDYVFSGATSQGKDFFPRLATSLERGLISDVTQFSFEGDNFQGVRPFFAGKCLAKAEFKGDKPYFASFRPNALGTDDPGTAGAGNVSTVDNSTDAIRAIVKEVIKGTSEKVDLTEANIIVSGGRAMKNSDNFKILDDLADVIGATVGASRAAVDSGYAPHAMQVGQTGKTVSPTLYIACGISGAIQHLAGMRTSKVIVAINTDPDAPIFAKADYGIVGDLFTIVPILTEEFKKLLK